MQTCRFCKKWDGDMVKYGVRHYAHHACFLDAGRTLEELHGWQVGEFPWRLLQERDLVATAEQLIAAKHFPVRPGRSRAKTF